MTALVVLSKHAAIRGFERFARNRHQAEVLAQRIVAKGRRVGPSSQDAKLTWIRHKSAIALAEITTDRVIVVSLMPGNWCIVAAPEGGYYAARPAAAA